MLEAKKIAEWKRRMISQWHQVRIAAVETDATHEYTVGDSLPVRVQVELGQIDPADVSVEAVVGLLDGHGEIQDGKPIQLTVAPERAADGSCLFEGALPCKTSGRNGFTRIGPASKRNSRS